ncbi:hypothetical protein [Peribacillus deserti]|uniref:Uncharacterized protein n=1 Tax=Peribacillus deserti TaxID=673318 RepID=A0A2N5M612_9BACI|nr:hypothetical protein [Peribacillus deserti]PLT29804.1 hypothetical protein CUU66_10900 [Peribacillus deserti]
MKTCPYCGSEINQPLAPYYCSFCEMGITEEDIQEKGKRKDFLPEVQPTLQDLSKNTQELIRLSLIELVLLLKLARKERANLYKQRYIFIQAIKQGAEEYREGEQYTFIEYEKMTRKCFVLENLIRERMGYYPTFITNTFIRKLADRMIASLQKEMVIRPPKHSKI